MPEPSEIRIDVTDAHKAIFIAITRACDEQGLDKALARQIATRALDLLDTPK
ncbi:hypothetical protein [Paracoccus siganidrum]|uniref:hypothetical protein n=1 Tax=Paracoccus siganidrum TaxID=1276757 RepID=UPI0014743F9F|nr:hypothetical protein [Paracoccus siganidrum]